MGGGQKDTRATSLKTSQRSCNNSCLDKGAPSQEKAANTEEDNTHPQECIRLSPAEGWCLFLAADNPESV